MPQILRGSIPQVMYDAQEALLRKLFQQPQTMSTLKANLATTGIDRMDLKVFLSTFAIQINNLRPKLDCQTSLQKNSQRYLELMLRAYIVYSSRNLTVERALQKAGLLVCPLHRAYILTFSLFDLLKSEQYVVLDCVKKEMYVQ